MQANYKLISNYERFVMGCTPRDLICGVSMSKDECIKLTMEQMANRYFEQLEKARRKWIILEYDEENKLNVYGTYSTKEDAEKTIEEWLELESENIQSFRYETKEMDLF